MQPTVTDRPPAVAYPGRDGAHSAAACERLFPNGAEIRPLPSFLAVAEATVDAVRAKRDLIWVPMPMRFVMSGLRHVPRPLFRHLPI